MGFRYARKGASKQPSRQAGRQAAEQADKKRFSFKATML